MEGKITNIVNMFIFTSSVIIVLLHAHSVPCRHSPDQVVYYSKREGVGIRTPDSLGT